MLPLFQNNFVLVETTSSHFFRVTTSTQQLLFPGSYFFRTAPVFSFFRTVTFWQELFFQNSFFFGAKILLFQSSHFLRKGSSLRQLHFGVAIFFRRNCLGWRYLRKSYFFKAGTSAQHQPFQKSYILEKTDFLENQFLHNSFFWRAVFLEQLLFQKTLPSIAGTFSEELLFYNILFQKSYYFTATVPFYSYTSYLFVSN